MDVLLRESCLKFLMKSFPDFSLYEQLSMEVWEGCIRGKEVIVIKGWKIFHHSTVSRVKLL